MERSTSLLLFEAWSDWAVLLCTTVVPSRPAFPKGSHTVEIPGISSSMSAAQTPKFSSCLLRLELARKESARGESMRASAYLYASCCVVVREPSTDSEDSALLLHLQAFRFSAYDLSFAYLL